MTIAPVNSALSDACARTVWSSALKRRNDRPYFARPDVASREPIRKLSRFILGAGLTLCAHVPFSGDYRLVVGLAQLGWLVIVSVRMLHIETEGAAGARTLLLLQPDFFFGDVGERGDG
jgi:hypothetical protein